jgi:hypothetical protein
VLLLDGHSSHYTLDVVQFAHANNIILLAYPPHCTHALQGLDVACFAKMKSAWKDEINTFEERNRRQVRKSDFTSVFGHAYLKAFTPDLVAAAFQATGIHPFNPNVISEKQMKPSEPHSVKGSFLLPQISPVRCIMAAMQAQSSKNTSEPASPTLHNDHLDPALFTPSR